MATKIQRIMAGSLAGLMLCGVGLAAPISEGFDTGALMPAIAQAKTSTMVKNHMFTSSPSEFQAMLEAALSDLGEMGDVTYTTAMSKDDDGAAKLDVNKGSKTLACVEFTIYDKDDYWVSYADRKEKKSFDTAIAFFRDCSDREECIAYTSLALIMIADPSLDIDDALALAYDLPDVNLDRDGNGFNSVEKNGIKYSLVVYNGDWSLFVSCAD